VAEPPSAEARPPRRDEVIVEQKDEVHSYIIARA
jgi:hypothetical protein